MTVYTGADTIAGDINLLPPGLDVYMSYVDNFGGYKELVQRFGNTTGHPFLVSITIFGNPARCADVEQGAMHVSDLPHWLDHVALGNDSFGPPWVYTSAGNMAAVKAAVGGRKVIYWSAHYGAGEHICGPSTCGFPQADWTQLDDHGAHGENIDRSIGTFYPTHTPPPTPPEGTVSITSFVNENGHDEYGVHLDTGEVKHIWKQKDPKTGLDAWPTRPDGGFDWKSLGNPGK